MNAKSIVFFCTIGWVCFLNVSGAGNGEKIIVDSVEQIQYANFLFQQREYYRAITEYKRYLYYFYDKPAGDYARLQIGRSFMAGGKSNDAVDYWKSLDEKDLLNAENHMRLKIYLSISYLDLDGGKPYGLRSQHIKAAFETIGGMDKDAFASKDFHRFSEAFHQYDSSEEHSPALAGSLSAVLPGAGSVYNGRYVEATYVFFLTSLFLYATLDSYRTGQRAYVPIFGFFTLAFYGGGIYTAVNGAYRQNDYQKAARLSKLRNQFQIQYDRR